MKILLILGLLLVTTARFGYGQTTTCQRDKVYGKWKSIGSKVGIISNLDSLKRVMIHVAGYDNIWDFQAGGTYTHMYNNEYRRKPYIQKGTFTFEQKSCEIIVGTKRKARVNANLELLYVDDQYLIIADDNNPKGYYTQLLSRQ